jgi:hypothetical protein
MKTFTPGLGNRLIYRFTPDHKMRLIRAMQAVLVFLWMLLEMLLKEMRSDAG